MAQPRRLTTMEQPFLRTPWLLDNAIITLWGPIIGPYAGWVFRCLAAHADNDTGQCYPSIDRIVTLTGISRTQVKRALKVLESCRLLSINHVTIAGSMPRRTYVTFTFPQEMPTVVPDEYQHLVPAPHNGNNGNNGDSEEGPTRTSNTTNVKGLRVLPGPSWGSYQDLHGGPTRTTELVLVENLSQRELVSQDDADSADAESGAASATPPAAPVERTRNPDAFDEVIEDRSKTEAAWPGPFMPDQPLTSTPDHYRWSPPYPPGTIPPPRPPDCPEVLPREPDQPREPWTVAPEPDTEPLVPPFPPKLDSVQLAIAAWEIRLGRRYLAHKQVVLDADTYTPKLRRQNVLARIAEQVLTLPVLVKYYPADDGTLDWLAVVTLLGKAAGTKHGCGSALRVLDAIYDAQACAGNPISAVLGATLRNGKQARASPGGNGNGSSRLPANGRVSTVFESDPIPD